MSHRQQPMELQEVKKTVHSDTVAVASRQNDQQVEAPAAQKSGFFFPRLPKHKQNDLRTAVLHRSLINVDGTPGIAGLALT